MATKTIMNDVVIKSKPLAHGFVSALENAKGKTSKEIELDRKVYEIKGQALREMFKK